MSKGEFIKDAVFVEKYTDKQTGEERKKYTKVGALFQREDGSLYMSFLNSWISFMIKSQAMRKSRICLMRQKKLCKTQV